MKIWKKILIISLAAIALTVTIFGIIAGCEYANYRFRDNYTHNSLEKRVSEHITMVHGDRAGYHFCRLKDTRTGKFTTPKLNHVFLGETTDDSIVVFRDYEREKRGYVNLNTGCIVIPARYDRAWNFSEGLAAVIKDGEVSFINAQGEKAIPTSFPFYFDDDHADYAFLFHQGLCVMINREHKWGLINTRGEWTVEPIYTQIDKPRFGYRIVSDGNHYGLLTATGKPVLPLEYDIIRYSSDSQGFFIAKDGYAKIVDKDLNTIVPFAHDGLYQLTYIHDYRSVDEYDENGNIKPATPSYWRYDVGWGSGIVDCHGNVIIPAKYYMVYLVDDNLFEVEVSCGGDRILFDHKGQYIGKSNF